MTSKMLNALFVSVLSQSVAFAGFGGLSSERVQKQLSLNPLNQPCRLCRACVPSETFPLLYSPTVSTGIPEIRPPRLIKVSMSLSATVFLFLFCFFATVMNCPGFVACVVAGNHEFLYWSVFEDAVMQFVLHQ